MGVAYHSIHSKRQSQWIFATLTGPQAVFGWSQVKIYDHVAAVSIVHIGVTTSWVRRLVNVDLIISKRQ